MAMYLVSDTDLTAIADEIREKGGTSAQLAFPAGFVSAVEAIPTGGGGGADTLAALCNGNLTKYSSAAVTSLVSAPFRGCGFVQSVFLPNCESICGAGYALSGTGIKYAVFPSLVSLEKYGNFDSCLTLEAVDIGTRFTSMRDTQFNKDTNFKTLIIRATESVPTLVTVGVFNNSPFATNGSGGTLYVPQALIADYQAATNWSTILGYANNSIIPIEGSIYETQYADGTPIAA